MARTLTLAPQLCVCALSHKRLDLLNTTLTAIVQHLELVETGLPYELVWVDNGSDEAERHALHRRFSFEKVLFLGTNYGMAYGFNTLFFRLCSAPYFLTLEEDWEWLPSRGVHVAPEVVSYETVGQTALRDAIAVLRHDTSLSGVFLRPDTLDQFLTRGSWRRAPRRAPPKSTTTRTRATVHAANGAAAVEDLSRAANSDGGGGGSASSGDRDVLEAFGSSIEYATYCMDKSASYLWGAYSNGPGIYDRNRLMKRVGRQFGEPSDAFPDPASESNYAYRVGAAGLCSAVLRVWPGCEGVLQCNAPLFKHLGDERSHGYGKGTKPDVRWLVHGSGSPHDEALVRLRSLDVEPSMHWLSLYLSQGERSSAWHQQGITAATGEGGERRIAILIGARGVTLQQVGAMARSALAAAHAPSQLEFLWHAPGDAEPGCLALNHALGEEHMRRMRLPSSHAHPTTFGFLRCITSVGGGREPASLAERFSALASATDAQLLLLCARVVTAFTHGTQLREADGGVLDSAWDRAVRAAFGGSGDVRHFPKDRILLLQARPSDPATPSAHVFVHRVAMEHLGYYSPAPAGEDWLLFTLWMQMTFGAVGRHRWLGDDVGGGATEEVGDAAKPPPAATPVTASGGGSGAVTLRLLEANGEEASGVAGSRDARVSGIGADHRGAGDSAAASSALRARFERSAGSRAIDTHRLASLILALQPKSRTAFERATTAYRTFSALYNAGRLAEAWPKLAELLWALETVERSDDWEVRDLVGPGMLPAAQDILARMLDRFGVEHERISRAAV